MPVIAVLEFVGVPRNFCEVMRHLGSCALLADEFASDLKLFYLPRSCLHTETKGAGEGELFPLLKLWMGCTYLSTPTRLVPPAAFQQSFPEILETTSDAGRKRGESLYRGRGEARPLSSSVRSRGSLFTEF